jgi:PleD family two-component response regulator
MQHSITFSSVQHEPLPLEVLVVDDSRLNRKMLLKCLRAEGYTCSEVRVMLSFYFSGYQLNTILILT